MSDWLETNIDLKNKHGLHMRPAQRIVEVAAKFNCDIRAVKDKFECNAKSILDMIEFAAHLVRATGDNDNSFIFRANGPDAEKALAALAALVNDRSFGFEETATQ